MENTTQTPEGKGMAVAGFVISLIALVLWTFISVAAVFAAALGGGMGLAGFWLVFSLAGLVLSVMGMMKLGKTGGKKGLAIAGLVLGLVATLLSVSTVMGVSKAQTEFEKVGLGSKALETVGNAMEEGLKTAADSLKNAQ